MFKLDFEMNVHKDLNLMSYFEFKFYIISLEKKLSENKPKQQNTTPSAIVR